MQSRRGCCRKTNSACPFCVAFAALSGAFCALGYYMTRSKSVAQQAYNSTWVGSDTLIPVPSRPFYQIASEEVDVGKSEKLHYLHCRRKEHHLGSMNGVEVILLHGAAFTAATWRSSGIMDGLCGPDLTSSASVIASLTALDLAVKSDGNMLKTVFRELVNSKVLTGSGVVLITPSASGKTMTGGVGLTDTAMENEGASALKEIVKAWVPVACYSVAVASEKSLATFRHLHIPVMAIYGSKDPKGKRVSQILAEQAGADVREIEGRHPCYLDSPTAFMDLVRTFAASLLV